MISFTFTFVYTEYMSLKCKIKNVYTKVRNDSSLNAEIGSQANDRRFTANRKFNHVHLQQAYQHKHADASLYVEV